MVPSGWCRGRCQTSLQPGCRQVTSIWPPRAAWAGRQSHGSQLMRTVPGFQGWRSRHSSGMPGYGCPLGSSTAIFKHTIDNLAHGVRAARFRSPIPAVRRLLGRADGPGRAHCHRPARGGLTFGPPKSEAGRRTVSFPDLVSPDKRIERSRKAADDVPDTDDDGTAGVLARTGTLMARTPRSMIRMGVFCLVELRGLEPLTPCLQNPHRVSRTVHGLGRLIPLIHSNLPRSRLVGVSHGCHLGGPLRPELSARANPRFSGAAIHRTGTLHARARQDGSMMRGTMRV